MMYIRLSLQLACTGASPQTNVMGTLNMLGLAKRVRVRLPELHCFPSDPEATSTVIPAPRRRDSC